MKIKKTFNKIKLSAIKHSPEILMGAGIIGAIGSTVIACKATTKLSGILEQYEDQMAKVDAVVSLNRNDYTAEDGKKDKVIIKTQSTIKIVKLYAPSVIVGILSYSAIFSSNKIMRKRTAALSLAYAALHKSYTEYSNRVIERFGETVDKELRYGLKSEKITVTETDENGNTKKVKKEGLVIGDMQLSEYARVFDESCSEYDRNPEYSLFLLQSRQNVANQLLKVRGYLFLNDIYRELGMPETKAGQVVGWLDDDSPDAKDGHIDLRITETYRRLDDDTVETVYIIDPNVDGPILDTFERQ